MISLYLANAHFCLAGEQEINLYIAYCLLAKQVHDIYAWIGQIECPCWMAIMSKIVVIHVPLKCYEEQV